MKPPRSNYCVARFLVAGILGLFVSGCTIPTDPEPTLTVPLVASPRPTSTPLAVEPTPGGGGGIGTFYKPPGWDGISDVDCVDFDTYAHAQSFFIGTRGSTTNDPYRLDNDGDGIACEDLP